MSRTKVFNPGTEAVKVALRMRWAGRAKNKAVAAVAKYLQPYLEPDAVFERACFIVERVYVHEVRPGPARPGTLEELMEP
jgi:hypothetical protein